MRFKYFLLVLLLSFKTIAIALPVIIEGKSAAYDNYVFRVYLEKDPISGVEYLADQQRPDASGHFSLGFELHNIQRIRIEVGLQSISFYAIPGKSYSLNFNEITINDQNVFLPQKPLSITFAKQDMLNIVLDGFDYEYQQFLEQNFMILIKYHDRELFNNFKSEMFAKLKDSPISDSYSYTYIKDYIDYTLAELSFTAKLKNHDSLGINYFTNKDILFNNPAYISFFKKYFSKYFIKTNGGKEYYEIRNLINEGPLTFKIMDKLGKDPILLKEKLREIVLLNSLKQIFYNHDFNITKINDLFSEISTKSKFKNNCIVAENLLHSLNRFIKGNSVPDFNLLNIENQTKDISSYKGKKTFLMFVSPSCETCEADIRILKAKHADIKGDINLVTIYAGYNKHDAEKWAQKQDAAWDFLWFENNFELLNDYKIKTFPKYIILDENSLLFNYFPPKPRENLFSYLEALKKQTDEKNNPSQEGKIDIFRKN